MRGRKNPATNQPPPNLPPCKVCGEQGTGFHYGVTTCGACKGFFRRSLVRNEPYVCTGNGTCHIGPETKRRKSCPKCRYDKCLAVGMCKEAIKTGRYSYVKKSQDIIEMIEHQIHDVNSHEQSCEGIVLLPQKTKGPPEALTQKKPRPSCALEKTHSPIKVRSNEYMEVSPTKLDQNAFHFENMPPESGMLASGDPNDTRQIGVMDTDVPLHSPEMGANPNSCKSFQHSIAKELPSVCDLNDQHLSITSQQYHCWDILPTSSSQTATTSSASDPALALPVSQLLPVTNIEAPFQTSLTSDDFPCEDFYSPCPAMISNVCLKERGAFHCTDSNLFPLSYSYKTNESQEVMNENTTKSSFASQINETYVTSRDILNQIVSFPSPVDEEMDQVCYNTYDQRHRDMAVTDPNNVHFCVYDKGTSVRADKDNALHTPISFELEQIRRNSWENEQFDGQISDHRNTREINSSMTENSTENRRAHGYCLAESVSSDKTAYSANDYESCNGSGGKLYLDLDAKMVGTKGELFCRDSYVSDYNSSDLPSCVDGVYPFSNFVDFLCTDDSIICHPTSSLTETKPLPLSSTVPSSAQEYLSAPGYRDGMPHQPLVQGESVTARPVNVNCSSLCHWGISDVSTILHSSTSSSTSMSLSMSDTDSEGDSNSFSEHNAYDVNTSFTVSLDSVPEPLNFLHLPQTFSKPSKNGSDENTLNSKELHRSQVEHMHEELMKKWTPFKSINETLRLKETENVAAKPRLHKNDYDYYHKQLPWCEFTEVELDDVVNCLKSSHKKYVGVSSCHLSDDEISEKEDSFLKILESTQMYGELSSLEREDYYRILEVTGIDIGMFKEYQQAAATIMNRNLEKIVRFFRSIPGFKDICQEDKILLAKESMHECSMIGNFRGINAEKKTYLDTELRVAMSWDHIHPLYPECSRFMEDVFEVSKRLKDLNLSIEEILILKAISISSPDRIQLKEFEKVYSIYWRLHCCLLLQFWRSREAPLQEYSRVISILTDLRDINHRCREIMKELKPHVVRMIQHTEVPLFMEIFFAG